MNKFIYEKYNPSKLFCHIRYLSGCNFTWNIVSNNIRMIDVAFPLSFRFSIMKYNDNHCHSGSFMYSSLYMRKFWLNSWILYNFTDVLFLGTDTHQRSITRIKIKLWKLVFTFIPFCLFRRIQIISFFLENKLKLKSEDKSNIAFVN